MTVSKSHLPRFSASQQPPIPKNKFVVKKNRLFSASKEYKDQNKAIHDKKWELYYQYYENENGAGEQAYARNGYRENHNLSSSRAGLRYLHTIDSEVVTKENMNKDDDKES